MGNLNPKDAFPFEGKVSACEDRERWGVLTGNPFYILVI